MIRASRVPVVSAVGHETDFTIADFAADMRAPTPSAAAELVAADMQTLEEQLEAMGQTLTLQMERVLLQKQYQLGALGAALKAHQPSQRLRENAIRLHALQERLHRAMREKLAQGTLKLGALQSKLHALSSHAVLARGYAMVLQDGKVVTHLSHLQAGQEATLQMAGGSAQIQILSLKEGNGDGNA